MQLLSELSATEVSFDWSASRYGPCHQTTAHGLMSLYHKVVLSPLLFKETGLLHSLRLVSGKHACSCPGFCLSGARWQLLDQPLGQSAIQWCSTPIDIR